MEQVKRFDFFRTLQEILTAKYKIELDRDTCIGTHNCCAEAQDFWLKADDGKVDLKNAICNKSLDRWELIIELSEPEIEDNKRAEKGCPVDAIRVVKWETS